MSAICSFFTISPGTKSSRRRSEPIENPFLEKFIENPAENREISAENPAKIEENDAKIREWIVGMGIGKWRYVMMMAIHSRIFRQNHTENHSENHNENHRKVDDNENDDDDDDDDYDENDDNNDDEKNETSALHSPVSMDFSVVSSFSLQSSMRYLEANPADFLVLHENKHDSNNVLFASCFGFSPAKFMRAWHDMATELVEMSCRSVQGLEMVLKSIAWKQRETATTEEIELLHRLIASTGVLQTTIHKEVRTSLLSSIMRVIVNYIVERDAFAECHPHHECLVYDAKLVASLVALVDLWGAPFPAAVSSSLVGLLLSKFLDLGTIDSSTHLPQLAHVLTVLLRNSPEFTPQTLFKYTQILCTLVCTIGDVVRNGRLHGNISGSISQQQQHRRTASHPQPSLMGTSSAAAMSEVDLYNFSEATSTNDTNNTPSMRAAMPDEFVMLGNDPMHTSSLMTPQMAKSTSNQARQQNQTQNHTQNQQQQQQKPLNPVPLFQRYSIDDLNDIYRVLKEAIFAMLEQNLADGRSELMHSSPLELLHALPLSRAAAGPVSQPSQQETATLISSLEFDHLLMSSSSAVSVSSMGDDPRGSVNEHSYIFLELPTGKLAFVSRQNAIPYWLQHFGPRDDAFMLARARSIFSARELLARLATWARTTVPTPAGNGTATHSSKITGMSPRLAAGAPGSPLVSGRGTASNNGHSHRRQLSEIEPLNLHTPSLTAESDPDVSIVDFESFAGGDNNNYDQSNSNNNGNNNGSGTGDFVSASWHEHGAAMLPMDDHDGNLGFEEQSFSTPFSSQQQQQQQQTGQQHGMETSDFAEMDLGGHDQAEAPMSGSLASGTAAGAAPPAPAPSSSARDRERSVSDSSSFAADSNQQPKQVIPQQTARASGHRQSIDGRDPKYRAASVVIQWLPSRWSDFEMPPRSGSMLWATEAGRKEYIDVKDLLFFEREDPRVDGLLQGLSRTLLHPNNFARSLFQYYGSSGIVSVLMVYRWLMNARQLFLQLQDIALERLDSSDIELEESDHEDSNHQDPPERFGTPKSQSAAAASSSSSAAAAAAAATSSAGTGPMGLGGIIGSASGTGNTSSPVKPRGGTGSSPATTPNNSSARGKPPRSSSLRPSDEPQAAGGGVLTPGKFSNMGPGDAHAGAASLSIFSGSLVSNISLRSVCEVIQAWAHHFPEDWDVDAGQGLLEMWKSFVKNRFSSSSPPAVVSTTDLKITDSMEDFFDLVKRFPKISLGSDLAEEFLAAGLYPGAQLTSLLPDHISVNALQDLLEMSQTSAEHFEESADGLLDNIVNAFNLIDWCVTKHLRIMIATCFHMGSSEFNPTSKNGTTLSGLKGLLQNSVDELLTRRLDSITNYVWRTLVMRGSEAERAETLSRFVYLAQALLQANNFLTSTLIIKVLNSPPVSQMQRTWALLAPKERSIFQGLVDGLLSGPNFSSLWSQYAAVRQRGVPAVPYWGNIIYELFRIGSIGSMAQAKQLGTSAGLGYDPSVIHAVDWLDFSAQLWDFASLGGGFKITCHGMVVKRMMLLSTEDKKVRLFGNLRKTLNDIVALENLPNVYSMAIPSASVEFFSAARLHEMLKTRVSLIKLHCSQKGKLAPLYISVGHASYREAEEASKTIPSLMKRLTSNSKHPEMEFSSSTDPMEVAHYLSSLQSREQTVFTIPKDILSRWAFEAPSYLNLA